MLCLFRMDESKRNLKMPLKQCGSVTAAIIFSIERLYLIISDILNRIFNCLN